jgi:hypothetical protein
MKQLFRFAAFIAIATTLTLSACTQDACKTNPPTCLSGATCADGSCVCPGGFAGATCGDTLRNPFFWRKKRLASNTSGISFRDSATTYRGVETNLSATPNTVDSVTVTISAVSAYYKIAITNFGNNVGNPYYLEATVASSAAFSISSYPLTATTDMTNVSGKLVGNELTALYSTQSRVPGILPTNFSFKGVKQ